MTPPLLRIIPESARKEWLSHEWHGEIATFVLPPRELVSVPRATATPGRQCSPEEAEAGIYDARGRLVAASLHQRRNKYFTAATPWELIQPRNAPILHGRHLYLGWFFDHYGHFILESLSRCWALAEAGSVDGYLFHRPETHRKAPAQLLRLLELLGIPQEKVRFIDSTTRFEELLVPSQQAVLARGISRETLDLYTRMAFRAWKQGGERRHNRSLYLSRRFLGSDMRQAANEWMLERSFRNEGYQVLHPHYMDGIDQLSIYYKAKRFAGLDGSGLHNILFAEAPEEMWMLGTENRLADSITQVELNRLKGCRTTLLLQSVTRSGRLPPQLTPFLVQPSSRLPAFEPTPLDRFNWLSQLASRLSRKGCNNADCAALEPEPEVDERWVLQVLLGSPIARDKPAPGTEEEQLSALLSVHRQLAAGKVGEAAEELERLLPAYRQHPEFLAFYTGVLRKKGDHEKALEMAAHALLLDPDNPRLLLLQAELLQEEEDNSGTLARLRSLTSRWPRFSPARVKLAEALARLERFDEAAQQLRSVLEQSSSAGGLWNRLTWYLFRAGKLSEAKEAALKSLEVTPGNEVAPAHLARIHLQLGEAEQALTWVERALERTPARTELHGLKKRILAIRE